MNKKSNREFAAGVTAMLLLTVFDQLTKYLAAAHLAHKPAIVLIPGVFELRYLENQSAAFGFDLVTFLQNRLQISYFVQHPHQFLRFKMAVFAVLTCCVIAGLLFVFKRVPAKRKRFLPMNLILVAFTAGAAGNCIDRVVRNYVIDFFYFSLIDFPIFNVADIYVTVSAFFVVVFGLFYYKEDDFNVIFPPKEKEEKRHENR